MRPNWGGVKEEPKVPSAGIVSTADPQVPSTTGASPHSQVNMNPY